MTRRILALIGPWIAASGGDNEKTPNLDPWWGKDLGSWQSLMGRDWFPGGLYTHSRRGSTPLRSTVVL